MQIYLAGPMRGLPDWNFPAFDAAEKRWREAGHEPMSPASIDRALGVTPENYPGGDGDPAISRRCMQIDIACLYSADAIGLLPGWEKSRGATAELALAYFLGLKVYDAVTMDRLENIDKLPWQELKERKNAPQSTQRKQRVQDIGGGNPLGNDPDNAAS